MSALETRRFAGVSLGGGKADRTAVAVLEYFPKQKRVFLRSLRERLKGEGETSADTALVEMLTGREENLESIAFDAPLQMPACIPCRLKCPGVEKCRVPDVRWMSEMHRKRARAKKPLKMFTPYTERPAEMWIANELEEPFSPSHALGANAAPLAARAQFLLKRIKNPTLEAYPKAAIWRIGRALKVQKSYLRFHAHSVDGDESRLAILKAIMDGGIAFVYQQDLKTMVEHNQAFEAFILALVAFLEARGQTEKPPAGFPKLASWIETPLAEIDWFG